MAAASDRVAAQGVPACDYNTCGFAVAVRWNGLAVVRGQSADRVANLNFLLPRSVAGAFDSKGVGADSARRWATAATRRRIVAATFTDAGLALGVASLVASRRGAGQAGNVAAAAVGLFAISVPIQFAADNALSRAVWWHNRQFTR